MVTDKVVLYLEYPHLVRGVPARFLAHMSVRADGEPIRSGELTLEIGPNRMTVQGPKREGLFTPEGSFADAGSFPGRLNIRSPQVTETVELGDIVVHPSTKEAQAAAQAAAKETPADLVPFLMEQQWKVKLLLARAAERTLVHRLALPAQVVIPEGKAAVVAPPLAGRLLAPPSGPPRTGDQVEAGQVMGYVEPPLGAGEFAQLRALELELDLKTLEVGRELASARARLASAERERERIGKLREQGLSTQPQFETAEQNLALARNDEQAAAGAKASLEAILARREAGPPGALRVPLRAPIAGQVVAAPRTAGEQVAPETMLFRITDTAMVWIEGRVSEFDLAQIREAAEASASFPALGGQALPITGPGGGRLLLTGPAVDPSSRTLLVRFEMPNPDGRLRPGMLAELLLDTDKATAATAIPVEAVVRDQGVPTAYVMIEGERFQKRELELGVQDGGFVAVLRGIAAGEHVAARGAYIVKLAALSPASFGPGHQH